MKKIILTLSVCFISVVLNVETAIAQKENRAQKKNMSLVDAVAVRIIISFKQTNTIRGCKPAMGFCITWNSTKEELANYRLREDEAKGEAWAQSGTDGTSQIVYNLPQVNLSPELFSKMALKKKYTVAEDTYIPAELVAKLYKDAGIKDVPAELKIAKGEYPVTVEGALVAEKGIQVTIIMKTSTYRNTISPLVILSEKK